MKVTRVALTNYGSYADADWSPDGARLVAIVGPNGAGKSTLVVDGPLHALYDGAAGDVDDVVRTGSTDSAAVVEFDFGAGHYRVTRRRSTRSGGKTSADLAMQGPDGTWTPLASGAREVPAAVRALLRMDEPTFRTAAVLAQRAADRFLTATPGKGTATEPGRAAILSSIVVPAEIPKAEARAREDARELEAKTTAALDEAARLDELLAGRPPLEAEHASVAAVLNLAERSAIENRKTADAARTKIAAIDARLATAEATAALVRTLEGRLTELGERYRAVGERKATATAATERSQAAITAGEGASSAAERVPALVAELARLQEVQVNAGRLDADLLAKRDAIAAKRHAGAGTHAGWGAEVAAARRSVDELTAAVTALRPVVCEKCGFRNVVDQAGVKGSLHEAQARLARLEREEPAADLSLAREEAALARLESRRRELGWDPAALATTTDALREAERIAARAEAADQARAALAEEKKAIAVADAEASSITDAGHLARAELETARAKIAALDVDRTERAATADVLAVVEQEGRDLERTRAGADHSLARIAAALEVLDGLAARRAELAEMLNRSTSDLHLLRRLVTAFGVTGIPARIIEGVLPELGAYANELLAELRPGMSLEIRGQRAKRDGSGVVESIDIAVRDEVGERRLERWSGGERTSIALSLAVALSRLVARRAGTAIRTLVVDEPDGLDADARRAFGHALRILAHHGELERVVLVTHHEDLAEAADVVYEVRKSAAGSVVGIRADDGTWTPMGDRGATDRELAEVS